MLVRFRKYDTIISKYDTTLREEKNFVFALGGCESLFILVLPLLRVLILIVMG